MKWLKTRNESKQYLVYHGSKDSIDSFDDNIGTFFTDDYWNAEGYAGDGYVYEGYLTLNNPLVIDCGGKKWDKLETIYGGSTQEIIGKVDNNRYDGIIFKNIKDNWIDDEDYQEPGTVFYAFNPKKSFKSI